MKKLLTRIVGATLGLALAIGVSVGAANNREAREVSASTQTLTFNLTSNPGGWPTANATDNAEQEYELNDVTYTFTTNNVKCNPGYLMCTSTAALGLPIVSGSKLTSVVAHNSSGCSTTTRVGISSSSSSASYVAGGAYQTWSTVNHDYTYTLTSTTSNTRYFVYVTNKNAQITSLTLTYETAASEPTVTGVAKKTAPSKTEYYPGESFNPSGLIVTVSYSGGDPVDVAYDEHDADFSWSPETITTAGDVQIQYKTYSTMKVTQAVTLVTPLTVSQAISAIDAAGDDPVQNSYVEGIVSQIDSYNDSYHSITYWISQDGTTTNQLQAYSGKGLYGANFSSVDDVDLGATVVVFGDLKKHNDVYEFNYNNYLVSYTAPVKTLSSIALSGTYPTEFFELDDFSHTGMVVTATYSNGGTKDVTAQSTFTGYDMSAPGVQTVTVSFTDEVTKTATYDITVKERLKIDYKSYNAETVAEGDYIIYYSGKILKNTISAQNRADYLTATPVNGVISTKAVSVVWHIAKDGDYYTLYNAAVGQYLASSSNKQAKLESDVTDNSRWSITVSEGTYDFINKAKAGGDYKYLRNNTTYGFAVYQNSTGGALSLYKKTVKSEIEASQPTRASLSYSYSRTSGVYEYSNVKISFGGLITQALWGTLNSESTISGYGVMISTADTVPAGYIGNNSFRSQYDLWLDAADGDVDAALDALCDQEKVFNFYKAGAPRLIEASDDRVDENTYVWNLAQTVTAPTNLARVYVAVAYIRTAAGLVILDEARESAATLAQKMITGPDDPAFDGSLADLASKAA